MPESNKKVRVAIIGVGNCASSLVQGVEQGELAPADQGPGDYGGDKKVRPERRLGGHQVDAEEGEAIDGGNLQKQGVVGMPEVFWLGQVRVP